ncbi:MAG TPA: RnfABCDGE type electron transport complex subunit G [Gemmatimonadales bacterium]|jgi:electron transport complex protein RnfG
MTGPGPAPRQPDVPAARLLLTLATAGAIAGLLIVVVFQRTQPTIQAYKAEQLRLAVFEVLGGPDRFDTLYVVGATLERQVPAGGSPESHEQVYAGYAGDRFVGYAISAGQPGFQDMVRLIFGYDPARGTIIGMKVLESKETPGLGDKIEKDSSFVAQFGNVTAPLVGIKSRDATGDPHEVDMITGATISSKTVINTINGALARLGPLLAARMAGVP